MLFEIGGEQKGFNSIIFQQTQNDVQHARSQWILYSTLVVFLDSNAIVSCREIHLSNMILNQIEFESDSTRCAPHWKETKLNQV